MFLTDRKIVERPPVGDAPVVLPRIPVDAEPRSVPAGPSEDDDTFAVMRQQLKSGVQVVSVPQLFPTPPELARRMVALAGGVSLAGKRILEPSAGTGVLLEAIWNGCMGADCVRTVAVEINTRLCMLLEESRMRWLHANADRHPVVCADFTTCGDELGKFDAILMNPPFAQKQDIRHVTHALTFLKPGGRLVAIVSAGLTFRSDCLTRDLRTWIKDHGGTIEPLPPETFLESGTAVNTVLVTVDL